MFADNVWQIDLDKLKDYNNYFHQHNPNSLGERFSEESRLSEKHQRQELFDRNFGGRRNITTLARLDQISA